MKSGLLIFYVLLIVAFVYLLKLLMQKRKTHLNEPIEKEATDNENAESLFQEGKSLLSSPGSTPEDKKNGLEKLVKAEELGHVEAPYHLGFIFSRTDEAGGFSKRSVEHYMLAAERGFGPAQRMVGGFYELGISVEKDVKKAIEWYKKAAENEVDDALSMLATVYFRQKDYEEAVKWAEKSADCGIRLGYIQRAVYGFVPDGSFEKYKESQKWYYLYKKALLDVPNSPEKVTVQEAKLRKVLDESYDNICKFMAEMELNEDMSYSCDEGDDDVSCKILDYEKDKDTGHIHYVLDGEIKDGVFGLSGIITGDGVQAQWCREEMEFWVNFDRENSDKLLETMTSEYKTNVEKLFMLKELIMYRGGIDKFEKVCDAKGIKYNEHSF